MKLNQTLLKCGISENYLREICEEAAKKNINEITVFPSLVKSAKTNLKNSNVKVCSTISYPLGADVPEIKVQECKKAIADGADEISLVTNAAAIKAGMLDILKEEIKGVIDEAKKAGCTAKIIIEMPLLSNEEVMRTVEIADELGADVIQTSTGFKPLQKRSITKDDIALVLSAVKNAKVEAVGENNSVSKAKMMAEFGAFTVASDVAVAF